MEFIAASYALILSGVLSTFGIGAFLYALAALGEAKDGLKKINDSAKFEQNRSVTLNRIGEFIDLHGQLLQLSKLYYKKLQFILISNTETKFRV